MKNKLWITMNVLTFALHCKTVSAWLGLPRGVVDWAHFQTAISMENATTYKWNTCRKEHFITRKEKYQYVVRAVSAVAILATDISYYTSKWSFYFWWLLHNIQVVQAYSNFHKHQIFEIDSRYKLVQFDRPLKHFEQSAVIPILCDYIS